MLQYTFTSFPAAFVMTYKPFFLLPALYTSLPVHPRCEFSCFCLRRRNNMFIIAHTYAPTTVHHVCTMYENLCAPGKPNCPDESRRTCGQQGIRMSCRTAQSVRTTFLGSEAHTVSGFGWFRRLDGRQLAHCQGFAQPVRELCWRGGLPLLCCARRNFATHRVCFWCGLHHREYIFVVTRLGLQAPAVFKSARAHAFKLPSFARGPCCTRPVLLARLCIVCDGMDGTYGDVIQIANIFKFNTASTCTVATLL